MSKIVNIVTAPFRWFGRRSLLGKIVTIGLIVIIGWFALPRIFASKTATPTYQTAQVTRGTIVVSVSASGQVTSANSSQITTEASGVVKNVFVKDGDTVKTGDKIAEFDLDLIGKQKADAAYASYQSAKNNLETAQNAYFTLQSDMLTKWNTYMNLAQDGQYQNGDGTPRNDERQLPQFMSTNDDWLAAEAKYKQQALAVTQAQSALSSAWMSYQQSSSTIYAPISGVVTGLSLQTGSVITSQNTSNSSSTNTVTAQKVANIKTDANPTITINLTEIDVPNVALGDRATVTLDSFPDKTFTGKVISIDTIGVVSSGVTSYPVVIQFDTANPEILSNMTAQANIITNTKDNVLTVPSTAVQTQNGQTFVRTLQNGQLQQISVQTGISSDTDTEIVSGLTEGQEIVTSVITAATTTSRTTTSPFSAIGGFGGGLRTGGGGGGNRGAAAGR